MSVVARSNSVDDLLEKLDELPTLPPVVYELSRIINDPMSNTSEVERVMQNDQSLTTKVLKLANSAYFGVPGGVSNLQKAIAFLGYDTVHQLVLGASIMEALEVSGPTKFDLNEFWRHAIGTAMAAETVAKRVGVKVPADLFTCGLVHDMGKVVLYMIDTDQFMKNVQIARDDDVTFLDAENKENIIPHTALGHLLAKKWLLPNAIQQCILHHHEANPEKRLHVSAELNQYVDIVFLANLMVHALKYGDSGYNKVGALPKAIFSRLGLAPADLKDVTVRIKKALESADAFMAIIMG